MGICVHDRERAKETQNINDIQFFFIIVLFIFAPSSENHFLFMTMHYRRAQRRKEEKKIISGLGNVFCFAQPLILNKGIFFFWMSVFWLPAARHYKSPSVCYYLHSTIIWQKHQRLISGWFFSAIRNAIKLKNALAVLMPRPDHNVLSCIWACVWIFTDVQCYQFSTLICSSEFM